VYGPVRRTVNLVRAATGGRPLVSYLTFQSADAEVRRTGVEGRHIAYLAETALPRELARPDAAVLRTALDLDERRDLHPQLFRWLGGDPKPLLGTRVCLIGLGFNTLRDQHPEAEVLAWVYDMCSRFGWIAGEHRALFADRLQAALDGCLARAGMADPTEPVAVGTARTLPGGDRVGWEEVITFLRTGVTGPVVLSLASSFPCPYLTMDAGMWQPPLPTTSDFDTSPAVADTDDESAIDAWYDLDPDVRWRLAVQALTGLPDRQWNPQSRPRLSNFTVDLLIAAAHQQAVRPR
jgi:hypothetical protein